MSGYQPSRPSTSSSRPTASPARGRRTWLTAVTPTCTLVEDLDSALAGLLQLQRPVGYRWLARTARTATASTGSARSRTATRAARRRARTTRTTRPRSPSRATPATPTRRAAATFRSTTCCPTMTDEPPAYWPRASPKREGAEDRGRHRWHAACDGDTDGGVLVDSVTYCPSTNTISYDATTADSARLDRRLRQRRAARGRVVVGGAAPARAVELGTSGPHARECLTGAWAGLTVSRRRRCRPATSTKRSRSWSAGNHQATDRGTAFDRVAAFRKGFKKWPECLRRTDPHCPARSRLRGLCPGGPHRAPASASASSTDPFRTNRCSVSLHHASAGAPYAQVRGSKNLRAPANLVLTVGRGASETSRPQLRRTESVNAMASLRARSRTCSSPKTTAACGSRWCARCASRATTSHTAADGDEALRGASSTQPDVIVLDVMMPGTSTASPCAAACAARRPHADPDADRPPRGLRPRGRPRRRRRRLPGEAVRARRAAGPAARAAAPHEHVGRRRGPAASATSCSTRRAGRPGAASASSSSPRPSSTCSSCCSFNAGIVLDRDTIYERIWGYDFETTSRSLDVYIGYLRRKTEADGEPRLIHTVRGVGYTRADHLSLRIRLTVDRRVDRARSWSSARVRRARQHAATRCAPRPTGSCAAIAPTGVRSSSRPGDLGGDSGRTTRRRRRRPRPGRTAEPTRSQQIIDRRRHGRPHRSRPARAARSTPQDRAIAAQPRRTPRFRDVTVNGTEYRMLTASLQRGGAVQIARLIGDQRRARRARDSAACSSRSSASRRRAARVADPAPRRAPGRAAHATAEHIAATQDLTTPIAGRRQRRGRPPGRELQHDARRARHVARAAAAAGGRREPRAAHAAHRLRTNIDFLGARDHARRRASAAQLSARPEVELEELTDLVDRAGRARHRRAQPRSRSSPSTSASSPTDVVDAAGAGPAGDHASTVDAAGTSTGRRGDARPRGPQPGRQRAEVQPRRQPVDVT